MQILDDGRVIFSGTIASFNQSLPFGLTETLKAGDTIDFVVDTGNGGVYTDLSTGLAVTISTLGVGAAPAAMNNLGTIDITGTTTLAEESWSIPVW